MQDVVATAVIANVAKILHERGIQRQTFAETLGVKPSSLTKMLSRDKPMRTDSIQKLAVALGVSPFDLVNGTEPAGKPKRKG